MAKARAVACEALRRIGELLNETERNIGTRGQLVGPGIIGPSQSEGPIETPLTLAELGIDYKTSSIAQKLFALPLARFEDIRDGRKTLAEVDAAAKRAADFRATLDLIDRRSAPDAAALRVCSCAELFASTSRRRLMRGTLPIRMRRVSDRFQGLSGAWPPLAPGVQPYTRL